MPRLVVDPRTKYGFEANFNPALRMSNGAKTSIMFKMDQEKARYEKTIKLINWHQKIDARITEKQLEDVKKELVLMRAYQHVAKQTAFKKFDPVIRRRRERMERQRLEEEEAAAREKQVEGSDEEENGDESEIKQEVLEENRRLSMTGNVFITLKDIIGNDKILKRKRNEINTIRRKSSQSIDLDYGEESLTPRRRRSDVSLGQRHSRRESLVSVESNGSDVLKDTGSVDEIDGDNGVTYGNSLDVGRMYQRRRRSRAGSYGTVELDSIKESHAETGKVKDIHVANDERTADEKTNNLDSNVENKSKRLVVSGRKGFKTGNFLKGFFLTADEDASEEKENQSKHIDCHVTSNRKDKPMTIFQISKMYEQQKSNHLEECKNRELNHHKKLEQMKYESIRRRLQQDKFEKEKNRENKSLDSKKGVNEKDPKSDISSEETKPTKDASCSTNAKPQTQQNIPTLNEPKEDTDATVPSTESLCKLGAPLKGIARFKNAATAVSVQIKISKGDKTDRLKTLAAAVVMKKNTTAGRVPKAFMFNHDDQSKSPRDVSKATTLEASHRKPGDCKIRPLAMPEGVKAEYATKWKELMANVNYAVHWKVRALREDTGTLNSRQLRRQVNKECSRPGASPRAVFPGSCKTTWAMKRFVSQEVDDVLKEWNPDNVRRKRNQKMRDKMSLPDFVDRIRTTSCILKSFRDYKKKKDGRDDDGNDDESDDKNDEGDVDDNDGDGDDGEEEVLQSSNSLIPYSA